MNITAMKKRYFMKHYKSTQKGITLIELMVAIGIMAVIAGGSFQVFQNIQSAESRIQLRLDEIEKLRRAFQIIENDLIFAVDRAPRVSQETFGENGIKFFGTAFAGDQKGFQFSRNSVLPSLVQSKTEKSEQRRVAYYFEDEQLVRYQWEHLDPGPEAIPTQTPILSQLQGFELQFHEPKPLEVKGIQTASARWVGEWPPLSSDQQSQGLPTSQQTNQNNVNIGQSASTPGNLPVLLELKIESVRQPIL